eukprot:c20611_g1_i1 orf=496-2277(-)
MAVTSSPQPRVFRDLQLSLLSANSSPLPADSAAPFNWGPSVPVIATVSSDQSGKHVDFQPMSNDADGASNFQCHLQHTQVFKVGPTSQMWMVDEGSSSKAPYSKGFAVSFTSEEASNCLFTAVEECRSGGLCLAGDILANGSVDHSNGGNRFDKKIESSSAKLYFHYYGQLLHQQNMLQDYVRTGTYYAAVLENYIDFQGRVVVDVGAGSGILSLFAAQAGAKHVYAVEASGMAEHARKLIAGNPALSSVITVIHGKVEEVQLPEKADILISEPMGTLLINERMLESYIISRDRFLNPNGKMFPSLGRIHLAPFSDEYLHVEIASKALFWQQPNYYGVDLTSLYQTAFQGYFSQPVVDAFDPRLLVTPPISHTIDFTKIKEEEFYEMNIPLNFTATMATRIHGLACWFDVLFNGSSVQRWLTTAPGAPTTHWYQLRCVLSQPLCVMAGQLITGNLNMVAHSAQSYTLNLTMSVKMWNGPVQAVVQTSSGKLDLKEPYYRMSQPQAYVWTQDQMQQMQVQQQANQPSQQVQAQSSQIQNEPSTATQQSSPSAVWAAGQRQQQTQPQQQQQQPMSSLHQFSNQQASQQNFWGSSS